MIVNLPKMLHEALLRGQVGSKKAMELAKKLSDKANASGNLDENIAAVRAFQLATETQASHAMTIANVMGMIHAMQSQDGNVGMDSECDDDDCPVHGGNKPN